MAITQDNADKFGSRLKSFYDSLGDDEKQVLDQILEQAAGAEGGQEASPQRPFFDRFLTLNPAQPAGVNPGQFVTLKFPSDSDESDESDTC